MKYIVLTLGFLVCVASVESYDILDARMDAYVDAEFSNLNTGDDVILTVFADWVNYLSGSTKTLIWFDMDDLQPGAFYIMDATLILHLEGAENEVDTVEVFQAGEEWTEMGVTWNTRPAEDKSISKLALPPDTGVFEVDVTDFVRAWVELDVPNYGFYVDVPDRNNWVDIDFASRENPVEELRPKLDVFHIVNDVEENQPSVAEFLVTPVTTNTIGIDFTIPSSCPVSVKVFDASGSLVQTLVEGQSSAENHQFTWSAENPGVYFVKLEAGEFRVTRRAVIVR